MKMSLGGKNYLEQVLADAEEENGELGLVLVGYSPTSC